MGGRGPRCHEPVQLFDRAMNSLMSKLGLVEALSWAHCSTAQVSI